VNGWPDCRNAHSRQGTNRVVADSIREHVILRSMPRRSPRFIALLLWLVIALLPIRAMASAVMPVMMMAGLPSSDVSAPAEKIVMPCHAAMADAADDAAATDMNHTCSLCDLCHGSVAAAPQAAVPAPTAHEPQPQGVVPADIEPRAPDSLFRPPRPALV
jgi:hypothetical protein